MNDFSASLLSERLWFGKYPTQTELNIITEEGITHIVNLCTPEEVTWEPYQITRSSGIKIISYPFEDGKAQKPLSEVSPKVDEWTSFLPFIKNLIGFLRIRTNKVYIHCKGGHGRSPTIAGIVYGLLENKGPEEVLKEVRAAHQTRKTMLDKWRKLGAPQRVKQKTLIRIMLSKE